MTQKEQQPHVFDSFVKKEVNLLSRDCWGSKNFFFPCFYSVSITSSPFMREFSISGQIWHFIVVHLQILLHGWQSVRVQRLHHRGRTPGTQNQDPEKHDERSQGAFLSSDISVASSPVRKVCVLPWEMSFFRPDCLFGLWWVWNLYEWTLSVGFVAIVCVWMNEWMGVTWLRSFCSRVRSTSCAFIAPEQSVKLRCFQFISMETCWVQHVEWVTSDWTDQWEAYCTRVRCFNFNSTPSKS